jgi:hypothetical protein
MYPVTHMTIAVGSVWVGERLWRRLRHGSDPSSAIDLRIVAVGSLLPDAIDKPLSRIGVEAFSYEATSGHTIGHTLLLSALVIAAGLLLSRRGEPRLLWFGLGSFTHLLVDPVVLYPGVLFWPASGWDFPFSHGIPSRYLIAGDVLLIVLGAAAIARSGRWRAKAASFLRRGECPLASVSQRMIDG